MECTADTDLDSKNTSDALKVVFSVCYAILALVGIASNIKLIRIFLRKNWSAPFNCLMVLQALFDLSYILVFTFNLALYVVPNIPEPHQSIIMFLSDCVYNCCAYTRVAITIERYLVICKNK